MKKVAFTERRGLSKIDLRNEVDDLIELAHRAADAADFAAAHWVNRFAKRLAQHGRLTPRQKEVIADVRERHGR